MSIDRHPLAPGYRICRAINGGWQLARNHGAGDPSSKETLHQLLSLVDAGFTTFDCADIYTGVEGLLGRLLRENRRRTQRVEIQVHTKFVPDLAALRQLSRETIEGAIDRSLTRLGVDRLDLVQLHWWDYGIPGLVDTAGVLQELRRAGKIRLVGVTNLDLPHLRELVDAGIEIATNQLQYSLLDRRAKGAMTDYCAKQGIALLAYGSLAGGLLTSHWLGRPHPAPPHANRSLTKYSLIVDEFGGWEPFQELLRTLARMGEGRNATIAEIAIAYPLSDPAVAAVIVGASHARHRASTRRALELEFSEATWNELRPILDAAPGPAGQVYGLEREPGGPHMAILRMNLNEGPG